MLLTGKRKKRKEKTVTSLQAAEDIRHPQIKISSSPILLASLTRSAHTSRASGNPAPFKSPGKRTKKKKRGKEEGGERERSILRLWEVAGKKALDRRGV